MSPENMATESNTSPSHETFRHEPSHTSNNIGNSVVATITIGLIAPQIFHNWYMALAVFGAAILMFSVSTAVVAHAIMVGSFRSWAKKVHGERLTRKEASDLLRRGRNATLTVEKTRAGIVLHRAAPIDQREPAPEGAAEIPAPLAA